MTITLEQDKADDTRRDRWGRYLVVPPEGGKPVAYTRATTVAKAIEDQHSLIAWKARVAAKGLTIRGELLKMIAVTDDRTKLDDLVEQAAQAGGATERRDEGIALHRAIELHLSGQPVPELFRGDVEAVVAALERHHLSVVGGMTERVVVDDERRIAGTFDLMVKHGSTLLIADVKTGKTLDYSGLSFATQLAIYAGAQALYTQGTAKDGSLDRRDQMPAVDRSVALVLHVQPGTGHCDIHDVDIAYGAEALELCLGVREARTRGRHLIAPRKTDTAGAPTEPDLQVGAATEGTATPSTVVGGQEPAAAPPPAAPSRREQVIDRLKALKQIDARWPQWVAARWPEGVPALASQAILAPADWGKVDELLAVAEREAQAPFPVLPDGEHGVVPSTTTSMLAAAAESQADRAASMGESWPPEQDDGGTVDDADVEVMLGRLGRLDGEGRRWALRVLGEARDGGVPVSLRASRSVRAFEISRALAACAETRGDDDPIARCALERVLGADRVQPGWPTGAVIGALGVDEARAWHDVVAALNAGSLVYVVDAQGERLEQSQQSQ